MRLGIDFGGTNLKTGIFSNDGKPILFIQNKLSEFTEGNLLENILNHVKNVSKNYKIKSGGLAIKGLVNTHTGIVEDDIGAGSLLAGINLIESFGNSLAIPFKVENDARAYSWGEFKFGAGRGSRAMVCMTLGTGLGCSVIVDGKSFHGSDQLGGLLGGHISIDKNGPECLCGNKGCLELYCSATGLMKLISREFSELEGENMLKDFFQEIENKQQKYFPLYKDFLENLSIGIVNVIHAYGPDLIVLGGGVINSAHIFLSELTGLVHKRAWTFPRKKVKIKISELGNRAAAVGVAFL